MKLQTLQIVHQLCQQILLVLYWQIFITKNVRHEIDWYILHTVLLVVMLLFIIAIICDHYAKHRSKLRNVLLC